MTEARWAVWDRCWELREGYEFGSFGWRHPLLTGAVGTAAVIALLLAAFYVEGTVPQVATYY